MVWIEMALADDFEAILDVMPPDWTQLELDLRIFDEDRYIETASIVVQVNAIPYSKNDWHWRIRCAREFGHAAAVPTVHGTLRVLDQLAIEGELAMREARSGRIELIPMWGRPESIRREFEQRRFQ